MLINERTAVRTNKVLLVPYCRHHVMCYNEWMQDPDIQVATGSEPLSIAEEYEMQQSWRNDTDKLTFISCTALVGSSTLPNHVGEIASMIGDVNMFISVHEEDDLKLSLVGELELMIAVKEFQRKGLGRSAVLTFLFYILQHETEIVEQYSGRSAINSNVKHFDYFVVKINESNGRSLSLFEGLGFKKTSDVPNFFAEFELRRGDLSLDTVKSLLAENGVHDYQEVEYHNDKVEE